MLAILSNLSSMRWNRCELDRLAWTIAQETVNPMERTGIAKRLPGHGGTYISGLSRAAFLSIGRRSSSSSSTTRGSLRPVGAALPEPLAQRACRLLAWTARLLPTARYQAVSFLFHATLKACFQLIYEEREMLVRPFGN